LLAVRAFAIANRNLLDVAILAEELRPAQGLQQFVLPHSRCETCHVNEVLLDDADANQILAIVFLSFAFLYLFLSLFRCSPFLILLYVRSELCDSAIRQHTWSTSLWRG
jgi:hypothetical protein